MSKIIRDSNFEPSMNAKSWWWFVNKKRRKYNLENDKEVFYGVFDLESYDNSMFFFYFGILVEIVTIVLLWNYMEQHWILVLPFFIDIGIALFAQYFEKGICVNGNDSVLAKANLIKLKGINQGNYIRTLVAKKNRNIYFKFLSHLLLVLVLLLKASWIFLYIPGSPYYKFFIIGLNLAVCIIHIRYTANFLIGSWLRYLVTKEYSKFDKFEENEFKVKKFRRTPIEADVRIVEVQPTNTLPHKIESNEEGKQILYTWGMLEDEDLYSLIEEQDNEHQKYLVALFGLKCQTKQIMEGDIIA